MRSRFNSRIFPAGSVPFERTSISPILAFLITIVVLCHTVLGSAATRQISAQTAYYRAQRLRQALRRRSNCSLVNYLAVIRRYQLVYHIDPEYRNAPVALAGAAELYAEAGRDFANDRYSAKGIEAYRFLIAQYPNIRLSREALFRIGEIYRNDIEDPVAARAAYRQYLERYPRSALAADAARNIALINEALSEQEGDPTDRDRQPFRADSQACSGCATEVQSVRRWIAPQYTRVVIQTGHEVKFNAMQLDHPPRLVFDLDDTRLSPTLARKSFPAEYGFLRRIRVAQFSPKITRVVLDVPQIETYSVFSLPHPFRLVIDIRGQSPQHAALLRQPSSASRGFGSTAELRPPMDGSGIETAASQGTARAGVRSTRASRDEPSAMGENADDSVVTPSSARGLLATGPPTLTRTLGLKVRRIVIDPGHGGHDTGTLGPAGIEEKNVVLDVALRLRRLILRKLGCQVVMTRSTDEFVPLEERTAIANEDGADLFISIHANASRDPGARGIETYYLNFTTNPEALAVAARENATSEQSVFQLQNLVRKIALSAKVDESRDFAKVVNHELVLHLDEDSDRQPDRGIKKAPFVVLIGANMPSILVEISFLSNPHDERLLQERQFRQEIAQALYDGIARYTEGLGTIRVAQRAVPQALTQNNSSF
jgi:N-acetylmuramoyl-L-alanine amidase